MPTAGAGESVETAVEVRVREGVNDQEAPAVGTSAVFALVGLWCGPILLSGWQVASIRPSIMWVSLSFAALGFLPAAEQRMCSGLDCIVPAVIASWNESQKSIM